MAASIRATRQSLGTRVSVRRLGLVPMHEAGGRTSDVWTSNLQKLNNYFAGVGDYSWKTHGLDLYFPAGGWGVNGTIVIPRAEGFTVTGAGVGDTRAEIEYGSYGGCVARLVNCQPALDILIDYAGMNMDWSGVMPCGYWEATDAGLLKSRIENHARVGIRQRCGDGVVGSGKWTSPHLVAPLFETAIQWGDSAFGDNADQWEIGRLYTPDCRVGIHSICRQSIGSTIGHHDGVRCELLHKFERGGGDFTCHKATLQNGPTALLETRAQVFDDGSFTYGRVKVDGTCGAEDVVLWRNLAPLEGENDASQFVVFENLHQADPATGKLIVEMRGFGRFHIDRGEQVGNLDITCYGGNPGFMHEINLEKIRTRNKPGGGSVPYDPEDYITLAGDTAYARVLLAHNVSVGNVRIAAPVEFKLSRSGGNTTRVEY